ncbi:hypothetical protein [Burkholderia ubonensis]|uniref:hypothetical protein n=1 Tax=Burkholderia ubonensis TaxID=101571 RepID=UPI00075E3715|nr:hypothetical protein [Burkholderia ubonensis]KVX93638.1 hypothetical protein WL08_24765 [Burkholderia ubonensis]
MALEPLPVASLTRYFDATASAAVNTAPQVQRQSGADTPTMSYVIRYQIHASKPARIQKSALPG